MDISVYLDFLRQWVNYSGQCWALPLAASGCRQFWMVVLFASVFSGVAFFSSVMFYGWRKVRAWKAYQQWLIDREKINPDIESQKWQGASAEFVDIDESELAEKIRASIKKPTD